MVGYRVARLNVQTGHREEVSVDFDGTSTNTSCVGQAVGVVGQLDGVGAAGVTAIVATAAGTVAWIMTPFPTGGSVVCEIPPGSNLPIVLAASKEIVPDSLALAPGRLYWMDGAVAHTATVR